MSSPDDELVIRDPRRTSHIVHLESEPHYRQDDEEPNTLDQPPAVTEPVSVSVAHRDESAIAADGSVSAFDDDSASSSSQPTATKETEKPARKE